MADAPPPRQTLRPSPSLVACTACRGAHVKCTGGGPTCDRCVEKGATCVWVESRRGFRPSRKDLSSAPSDNSSVSSSSNQDLQQRPFPTMFQQTAHSSTSEVNYGTSITRDGGGLPSPTSATHSYGYEGNVLPSPTTVSPTSTFDSTDVLLDLFYKFFHPSHPFVLPQRMGVQIPEFLKAVMRFGGSHFRSGSNREALKHAALAGLPYASENGFKVQAFALLAMTSFSRAEQEEGQGYLTKAVDLALWLGLHKAEFAIRFGNGDLTMQECWRRTWWDLFIVETLITSFTGQTGSARLPIVTTNVPLPGTCELYNACMPSSILRSFEEMQDRAFLDDDFQWPSFAYKIEAMYLLHSVGTLAVDSFAASNSQVEALDRRISNFRLSIPSSKSEALKPNGQVDEVMFGALMTAACAEITLHRPRSSLIYVRNHYRTLCTPEATQGLTAVGYRSHDAKALQAANSITNLLTLPGAPTSHTPCFACALTVATTVQLPAMVQSRPTEGAALKERIQLAITAMGSIAEVWPMALATKSQVASFAREILNLKQAPAPAPAAEQPQRQTRADAPSMATPSTSAPWAAEPLEQDFFVANQNWLMNLVGGGLSASEVDAWLHETSDTTQS